MSGSSCVFHIWVYIYIRSNLDFSTIRGDTGLFCHIEVSKIIEGVREQSQGRKDRLFHLLVTLTTKTYSINPWGGKKDPGVGFSWWQMQIRTLQILHLISSGWPVIRQSHMFVFAKSWHRLWTTVIMYC